MSVRPDEARVQEIGRELFERVAAERQALILADRWTAALFAWSLQHEDAKLRLFRFVDVLPALDSNRDLGPPPARILRRDATCPTPGPPHGARCRARGRPPRRRRGRRSCCARPSAAGAAPSSRAAHRPGARAALDAPASPAGVTLDLLGEACLSDAEADVYRRDMSIWFKRWPRGTPLAVGARLDTAPWGPLPRVNVSVKISALHPWLEPADPAGPTAAVKTRLRPILQAARACGAPSTSTWRPPPA